MNQKPRRTKIVLTDMSKLMDLMDVHLGIAKPDETIYYVPAWMKDNYRNYEETRTINAWPKKEKEKPVILDRWAEYEELPPEKKAIKAKNIYERIKAEREQYQEEMNNAKSIKLDWRRIKLVHESGSLYFDTYKLRLSTHTG